MKDMDISLLLKKAEELRALFVLGQRVIPFLEEIFLFVNDIKPLLDEINTSIQDNLKKMPNASKQLSKVTEATERSTTEIMDIVDGLVFKSDIITSNVNKLAEFNSANKANPLKIIEILSKAINSDTDLQEVIPQIASEIKLFKQSGDSQFTDIVSSTTTIIDSIKDDSNSIMMSLQVQDITSQQIAAVNHLLQTVQSKLALIMQKFQSTEMDKLVTNDEAHEHDPNTNVTKLHRQIAFDPDAVDSLTGNDVRQGEVDALFDSHFNGAAVNEPASADDIDNLFANAANDDSPASIDDIDMLFSAANNTTVESNTPTPEVSSDSNDQLEDFSQDDIDALFGK
jgi:hypothetical protein